MKKPICGTTTIETIAGQGMRLDPEHYLGEQADAEVIEATESIERAKRRLVKAKGRLAIAKAKRTASQALVDEGKVQLRAR